MHIYTAAVYTNNYMTGQLRYNTKLTEHERSVVRALPHILESWHYVSKQKYVDEMRAVGAKVFLDSGAFSAYTLGVTLSVRDYCEYIWRNWDIIRFEDGVMMASVLDGIGDALQTFKNQKEMEYYKVKPLPCFHFGEDARYLEYYVQNYEYITLGGMVGASTEQLRNWLDKVWDTYLLDGAGRAKVKVHGFGITAVPLMEEFDWYSCDSSSWIQSAAFGNVMLPNGTSISVSGKSPARHTANQHASTFSQAHNEYLLRMFEAQGFPYQRLSDSYESRAAYNLQSFCILNERMNAVRKQNYLTGKRQDLFGGLLQ
jgi:hypothetical protein